MSRSSKRKAAPMEKGRKWLDEQARTRSRKFLWVQSFGRLKRAKAKRLTKQLHLSILCATDRNSCFVAEEKEERAMCVSRVRVIARRGNTPTAKRASKDIFSWSCERLQTLDWSVTRTQVNRHCYENFRLRGRRLQHIPSPLCIRLSA